MNKKTLLCFIIMLLPVMLLAQRYQPDEDDPEAPPQKLGIKVGICPSWLNAPEFQNQKPQVGLQGGFYYRVNPKRKNFHLQVEFTAAFRGAKFNNHDSGYSRLGLFYLDLPVYAMFSLDKKQGHNFLIGPVFSHLVRPTLFLSKDLYPAFTDMPLRNFDISIGTAYIRSFGLIGLSLGFKYSLLNAAKGNWGTFGAPGSSGSQGQIYLREVRPSLSEVQTIKNLSFELSLFF